MKPIYKAIAGVFAVTALLNGGTFAQVRYESRPTFAVTNPTCLGVIDAIDVVSRGGDNNNSAAGAICGAGVDHKIGEDKSGASAYRIRVRLDSGDYQSVMEDDLAGLRIGDRIQIDNGHVIEYRAAASEHYDSGGNPEQSG
jgi:hypothetical protein